MEQRKEHRFKPNQTATLTVLGMRPGPVLQVCILDISGSGMRLRSKLPVPCGAVIQVEVNHSVAHGSVCRCEADQDSYQLGIQVAETAPVLKY
jgi:PilZ domain